MVTTSAVFEAAHDATPSMSYFVNTIPLPPFITKVIAPFSVASASDIIFLAKEDGSVFDNTKEVSDPPAESTLKFCYLFFG